MGAICGILRFDGCDADAGAVQRMLDAMSYRAPDGHDVWRAGPVALGHGALHVTREDAFDIQPLQDGDLTLVGEVRLDNREELAAALGIAPARLGAMADSALLLGAYKTWGEDCGRHLLGDFVFAVWDAQARRLALIRDHMGQRGLLFFRGEGFFLFASDVAGLRTHRDVPRGLSDAQIGRMLIHDLGARGDTEPGAVGGFPGGTAMIVAADGTISKHTYWAPRADPAHEGKDEAYYIAAYRSVLGEAVACRLRRLVRQPGLIFSGGYDSGGIAALAGQTLRDGTKLIAATSVMPAEYRGTIRHARHWVDLCKRDMAWLDVHYITREGKSILSGLERHFAERGSPSNNYRFVQEELLSALAGAGARQIMDGHGGDYTLNPRGQAWLAHLLKRGKWRSALREVRAYRRLTRQPWRHILKNDIASPLLPVSLMTWWKRARTGFAPLWRDQPIADDFARELIASGTVDPKRLRLAARDASKMRAMLAEALNRVASAAAPGIGNEAARYGMVLTRPFHDKRVVELALAIPEALYVKHGRNRYLACMALKDLYPKEFQTRWRRNDDEIPDFQRMAKSIEPQILADIARMERSEKLSRYIDFKKIRRLLAARPGPEDHNSGWEQETQLALSGFLAARYIEWFRRDNS